MRFILGTLRLFTFFIVASTTTLLLFMLGILRAPYSLIYKVFSTSTAVIRFVLNIKLYVHGEVPIVQGVIMSNHRSYIDIVLIPSKVPYVIVAKRQVKSWPVIGQAGMALRTIFVDRDSAESRKRTRESIKERLISGLSVLIFPEGTTFEGPGVLGFKPGVFRHCAEGGFYVIPVAIEFRDKSMAWIGDDTFIRHFLYAFGRWRIDVDVSLGKPLSGNDGDALRTDCQAWVDAETRRLAEVYCSD